MRTAQKATRRLAIAFALTAPGTAFAQGAAPGGTAPPPGGPAPSGTAAAAGGGASTTIGSSTSTTFFPGGVAPVPPGGTLGGGNSEFSSSKPITGNERDSFDFQKGARSSTVHGSEGGSFLLGSSHSIGNASTHVVQKGDTLWDICDHYFQNPYQWPRVWAFNPQIQNPHWIFPGDQVRLRATQAAAVAAKESKSPVRGTILDRHRQVPAETVFLRTQGYISDESENWGEITGSPEEKMILTHLDHVYVRIPRSEDVQIGQELTVFRPVRSVGKGKVIEIQGTLTVSQWDPNTHIARAKITEALNAIERGARVGPIMRRFEVVSPTPAKGEIKATILASVNPNGFFGQNQVVFVDKGEDAGLQPGNRMFVIRKGDAWHASQTTGTVAQRIALEDDSPAATETVPKPRDSSKLPDEVLAELRVINVRKTTAMCIVSRSKHEIEIGDKVLTREGL